MAASIYDVANRAGVSISTVSRVLNNSAAVSDKKVAAVREALEFYQYEPNQFGRGLVKQRSNMIGIYFPAHDASVFDSAYNLELLKGIERVLSYQDYSMVLISENQEYDSRVETTPRYMECIRQKRIDGLLLSGLSDKAMKEKVFRQIMDEEYPVVYIGKRFHEKGLNVYAQFEQYMVHMAEVLYQQGHRRILFYVAALHGHYLQGISQQVKKRMPEARIQVQMMEDFGVSRNRLVRDLKKYVLEAGCTAICSPAMEATQRILSVCAELQISVPERVSIVSVEHRLGEGEAMYPQISAFYVPAQDMGAGAANLLLKAIQAQEKEESVEYETRYIERDSIRRI